MSTPERYLKQKIDGVFIEKLCHDEVQKCIQVIEKTYLFRKSYLVDRNTSRNNEIPRSAECEIIEYRKL